MSKEGGLLLVEVAEGVSVEDVRAATGASFNVSTCTHTLSKCDISILSALFTQVSPDLKPMEQV